MIEDPELRRMLEEELKVVRKEREGLVAEDTESLRHERKLRNREEEIERLLGLRKHPPDAIVQEQKKLKWLLVVLACLVAGLGVFAWASQSRLAALEQGFKDHEERLLGHETRVKTNEEALSGHEERVKANEERLREHGEGLQRHDEQLRQLISRDVSQP